MTRSGYTFAVIIPVYNGAETVGVAIDSALRQTLAPHEVIVCDDGSTDDTASVLDGYSERITVLHQENGGVSAASNRAARMARSDYLVKLDADDEWLPRRLEAMDALLAERPHLDIVTTDAWCRSQGRDVCRFYEVAAFPASEASQSVEILRANFVFGSAAFRRTTFLEHGGFRTDRRHQDEYDAWLAMVLNGSRVGLVEEPLAIYNRGRSVSVSSNLGALHRSTFDLLQETLNGRTLTPTQMTAIREHLRRRRLRMESAEALEAILGGDSRSRRLCLRAARTPGRPLSMRIRFVTAALFPRLSVGPAQRRRERRPW